MDMKEFHEKNYAARQERARYTVHRVSFEDFKAAAELVGAGWDVVLFWDNERAGESAFANGTEIAFRAKSGIVSLPCITPQGIEMSELLTLGHSAPAYPGDTQTRIGR